jgi:hypothetical protein
LLIPSFFPFKTIKPSSGDLCCSFPSCANNDTQVCAK